MPTQPEHPEYGSRPAGDIDRLIHEPARLSIVAFLAVVDSADFTFIGRQTGLTGGNLSSHVTKLETAGYVEVEKTFVGKKPRTMLRLTLSGRKALDTYREHMQHLLDVLPAGPAE